MGKNYYLLKCTAFLFLVVFLLSSCEKERDKYYDLPDWIRGNAWEIMEEEGNFSIFLKGIELCGYKDMVAGKGIITIFAPDDDAFKAYFQQNGISSIEDMDQEEILKLIGFHLVYYSYNKEMLLDYKPYGEVTSYRYRGIYNKFRTRSQDPFSYVVDENTEGNPTRKVYHRERYIPTFSSYFFIDFSMDANENYEFFFPKSQWPDVNNPVVNIANAQMVGDEIITNNGYLFQVDQVLIPLETMHTVLKENNDYSIFLSQYDRYMVLEYDPDLTASYGDNIYDSLFLIKHSSNLLNIASEWTTDQITSLATLASYTYWLFAPNNDAMNNFFSNNWGPGGYGTFDDVDILAMNRFLYGHSWNNDIQLFPEFITGNFLNTTSSSVGQIDFDPYDTDLHEITANGTLYGLKEPFESYYFKGALKPMYIYKNMRYFLWLVQRGSSTIELSIASTEGMSAFIPDNDLLTNPNGGYNGKYFVWEGEPESISDNKLMSYDVQTEESSNPAASEANRLLNNHAGYYMAQSNDGRYKAYRTLNSFQYLLMDTQDQRLMSTEMFNTGNNTDNIPVYERTQVQGEGLGTESFVLSKNDTGGGSLIGPELDSWFNALVFKDIYRYGESFDNGNGGIESPYTLFRSIISSSTDYLVEEPYFDFTLMSRTIVLVPTRQALENGMGTLIEMTPVEDGDSQDVVAAKKAYYNEYLKRYFVNVYSSGSLAVDYPFPGSVGAPQSMVTFYRRDDRSYQRFTLVDTGTGLQITDDKNNTVNVVGFFPNIYVDGAIYLIDGLLEIVE
ncbi:MAG: fasciclin domain-containing protein [Rikenellaceae bacterium]|nr:fasciclin domain-containing protein [Rikenellaceae bacterium]